MSIADCENCGVPHYVGGCPALVKAVRECGPVLAGEAMYRAAKVIRCSDCDGTGIGGHGGTCPICRGSGDQPL